MRIVIIGAMKEEINFLIGKLNNVKVEKINNFEFYQGDLFNKNIILVESGIGKVMSGILMATVYNNFKNIDKVINIGVAGGIGNIKIGDIVVGETYVYGDAEVTSFGTYRYGQMPRCPFLFSGDELLLKYSRELDANFATICTMDRFVDDYPRAQALIEEHFSDLNILCFDMESAAFAQSCYFYKLDFLAIRAISDVVGSSNPLDTYDNNLELACLNSNLFLLKLLEIF
jgi:adenosylhomocysteine nucleosidase